MSEIEKKVQDFYNRSPFPDYELSRFKDKEQLQLQTLSLRQVNIMNLKEIEAIGRKFDCVPCLGVLHHTPDAHQAFKNIATLLDDGGLIAVGLYNTFGRISLKLRKFLVRTVFKGREDIKQRFIRM